MSEDDFNKKIFKYDSFEDFQTEQINEDTKIVELLMSCLDKIEIMILGENQGENRTPILPELFHLQQYIIQLGKCIEDKKSQTVRRENICQNTGLNINHSHLNSIIKDSIVTPRVQGLNEIAGLWEIKKLLKSFVILPKTQPQLFADRKAFNSILLFGPPGTGKTHLVHALAYEAKALLFSITSSNILTPLVGQSEKNIQILFQYIRNNEAFSILFIDELDGFCKKRSDSEQDHTRRIKTELMCQISEMENNQNIFLICATNCPWDIDPAFMRRFQKCIYVPLPNSSERMALFQLFTRNSSFNIDENHWEYFVNKTEGFSGSDLSNLIQHALNIPILELQDTKIWKSTDGFYVPITRADDFKQDDIICKELNDLPPCSVKLREVETIDLINALDKVSYTMSKEDIRKYELFIKQ